MFPFKSKSEKPLYPPLTSEQDAFLATCTREYNEKLQKLNRDWNFSNYKTWGFDQMTGLFFLQLHDGSKVEADGQIIGSYVASRNSWEWAWNNPQVEEPMKRDVQLVRAFGEKEKIEYLSKGMVPAPDKLFSIYLAGIAIKIMGAEGLFAGNAGPVLVFISLKRLRRKSA
ncbi:MAG TPA: hypothetical protein VGN61_10565 [Verrucomicrobiae bacterium]|jgi:hypothetical protein